MVHISKTTKVTISVKKKISVKPVFQVRGGIPKSSGQNSKNERTSYVRNCVLIPKNFVPSKNIENCRRR